jgi:small basic protein (TIGR04137 family)
MSQHPSLKSSSKSSQHRSVLKRFERIKILKEQEKWKAGNSVFGLPKVKTLRFKIKKEKAAPAAETAEAIEPAAEEKTEHTVAKKPVEEQKKSKKEG